jgi:hypothetical protein
MSEMSAAPRPAPAGWWRALEGVKMWIAWVLATVMGGLFGVLVVALGYNPLALYLLLMGPFVAPAVAALPQALLLRRGEGRGRVLGWVAASTPAGLLIVGYLLVDITNLPTWDDLTRWYIPVTLVVGLLVTGLQAAALNRVLAPVRLLAYVPVTTAGWIVGWSVYLLDIQASVIAATGFWRTVGPFLGYAVPFAFIGAASGLVLAPALVRRARDGALVAPAPVQTSVAAGEVSDRPGGRAVDPSAPPRRSAGAAHVRRFAWGYAVVGLLGGILPGILFLGSLNGAWPLLMLAIAIYYLSLPAAAWLMGRRGWQGIGWTAKGCVVGVVVTTALLLVVLLLSSGSPAPRTRVPDGFVATTIWLHPSRGALLMRAGAYSSRPQQP